MDVLSANINSASSVGCPCVGIASLSSLASGLLVCDSNTGGSHDSFFDQLLLFQGDSNRGGSLGSFD